MVVGRCLDPGSEIIGRSTYTDNFSKYFASFKKEPPMLACLLPLYMQKLKLRRGRPPIRHAIYSTSKRSSK